MNKITQHKQKVFGLLISILFILLIIWNLDTEQLFETFNMFDYKVLFIFAPLYVFSLWLRGARWKCLLCNSNKLSIQEAFLSFTACNTINSYFPARAGDFWRAYHIGKKLDESKMKMLGSIILERIIDGISVLLILIFAVITYCKKPWVLNITYIATLLFLGSFTFFYILIKWNKIDVFFKKLQDIKILKRFEKGIDKTAELVKSFLEGFQSFNSLKCLSYAFSLSFIAWGIECYLTYVLITGFSNEYGFSISLFVISFIALSTIIPSSSIFVGPYQFAYIFALSLYHIAKSNALAIAFIHQVIIMLITTVITIFYFLTENTKLENIKSEIEDKINAKNA